jgi:hypothetical protein
VTAVNGRRLAVATGVATAANLSLFTVGSLAGATWSAGAPFTVSWVIVLVATIAPLALGGVVTSRIARRRPKALTWFAWAGLVFGILGSPMGYLMGGNVPTGFALGAMHVVTGLAWFWAIKPRASR